MKLCVSDEYVMSTIEMDRSKLLEQPEGTTNSPYVATSKQALKRLSSGAAIDEGPTKRARPSVSLIPGFTPAKAAALAKADGKRGPAGDQFR